MLFPFWKVGDSPLAGSGGYADSRSTDFDNLSWKKWRHICRSGAVSTTGHGESITKVCLAHRVVQDMQDEHPKKVFSNSIPIFASMTHDPRQGVMVWRTCRIGLEEVVELLRSMCLEGRTFLEFKYLTLASKVGCRVHHSPDALERHHQESFDIFLKNFHPK